MSACLAAADVRASTPGWLEWNAPIECQNTQEVERRLQSLLGRPVDFGAVPPTRVRMGWSVERGWAVRVTVELAQGPRDRALDAPSCVDALDVVALSLALILDPDFGGESQPQLAVESSGAAGPPLASNVGEVGDGPASTTALDAPTSEPAPGLEIAPTSRAPPADDRGKAAPDSDAVSRPITLIVGAGVLTDLGVFPVPQFGGGLSVALSKAALRLELEGQLMASESTMFAGAEYPVSFSSLFGALRGCYGVNVTGRLAWLGCAGGELGSLGTSELGGEGRSTRAFWLAAEALTGPELAATDWLRAFARLRAVAPLIRHEFLLSEGSRVHTLPPVSLQLEVGFSLDVTDLGGGEH